MAIVTTTSSSQQDLLAGLRNWIDGIEICDRRTAVWICRLIPSSCPLERDINLFGRQFHIPALCQINPVYDQVVALRDRAVTHLVEVWEEDGTQYL